MNTKNRHIKSLKFRYSKIIGHSISNHNDVLLVKSMLEENLSKNIGENISLSSLRRFFGFIPSTNPNRKTLDILSKGIGYVNFLNFCKSEEINTKWKLLELIIQIETEKKITQENILALINLRNENILLFSYFIFEIIVKEKFELLNNLFKNQEILPKERYNSGSVADIITLAMRQLSKKSVAKLIPYLNSNYLLRNYMIYYSVDHNSFHGWYMHIIKSNKINKNLDDSLFHELIINTSLFLGGKKINKLRKVSKHRFTKIHPILLGRYMGLKSIDSRDNQMIFDNVPKGSEILYFYEITTILILTKKFSSINKIENLYYEELLSRNGDTFDDKISIYLIAFSINNLKNNNNPKLAIKNLELINFELIVNSYKDYVRLLSFIPYYQIAILNNDNEKALNIIEEYRFLKTKLKFHFFSIKFLKTYFD